MNNNDIKKILEDLYALDPSLRSHEKELVSIIHAMAIKPEAHYDPTFAATLRTQLLAELKHQPTAPQMTLADFFMGRTFRYVTLAVAVIAIGAISVFAFQPKIGGPVAMNSSGVSITQTGANAFGPLSAGSVTTGGQTSAPAAPSPTNLVAPMAASPSGASGQASAGAAIVTARPISFAAVKYDYTGDTISQNQSQLNVLKKITVPFSADQATAALEQAGFGQVNLSSFSGLSMSNVTLSENQSFGYQISLDLTDGTISIDQNYNEWPQSDTSPLTASNIPSDAAVIATANQFFAAHGIAITTYGTPQVVRNNNLIVPVATPAGTTASPVATPTTGQAAMPMIPYYSDTEQVLYPLVVNGENVYDTNGNQIGLTVEVNVRYNHVASVYGLDSESYQSSAYDAITDTSTILSMAESAPTYPMIYNATNGSGAGGYNSSVTTYDLGTPTMAYEEIYQTDSSGQSSEFLVPAFVFPVTGVLGNDAPARNIMVPLIKDFEQQPPTSIVSPAHPIPPVPFVSGSSGGAAVPSSAQ